MSYPSPWRNVAQGTSGYRARPTSTSVQRTSSEGPPGDRDIMEGLSDKPLQIIPIPEEDPDQEDAVVTDYTYIGSYNWMKSETLTVLVPGSPPLWQNRATPYTIPPDRGFYYSDQNGFKMPKVILLPLIMAVNKRFEMINKPPFDWASVDIVTDRNGLRKLTRWVNGSSRDFRIDLQLAGEKTILMNRWSERYQEKFTGRTYGFSFEKASTYPAPGCEDSTGHHRIVTYDLNGLKMVLRFEVDACHLPPALTTKKRASNVDQLTASLNDITLDTTHAATHSNQPLTVLEGGSEVSSAAVIELTTRSQFNMGKGFDWKEAYPQLFFSQTANHYLAIHKYGHFAEIQKRKLSSVELKAVEQDVQMHLKKVRKALDLIRLIVIAHGNKGRLSLVCVSGELKVYERSSEESCLPDFAMKLFEPL